MKRYFLVIAALICIVLVGCADDSVTESAIEVETEAQPIIVTDVERETASDGTEYVTSLIETTEPDGTVTVESKNEIYYPEGSVYCDSVITMYHVDSTKTVTIMTTQTDKNGTLTVLKSEHLEYDSAGRQISEE